MDYMNLKECSLKDSSLTIREKVDSPVMDDLMTRFSDIRSIVEITAEELQEIKGLGKRKAIRIIAAIELGDRITRSTINSSPTIIRSPADISIYYRICDY